MIGASEKKDNLFFPVLMASLGVLFFCMLDAVMKAQALAMGAYSATLWRAAMGAVFASALYLPNRPQLATGRILRLHITRGVLTAFMMLFLFWSLDTTATRSGCWAELCCTDHCLYLAPPMLGEEITSGAKIAAVLGFGGIVVIAGEDMFQVRDDGSLLGISAVLIFAVMYALNIILQRKQPWWHDPRKSPAIKNVIMTCILAIGAPFAVTLPADIVQWTAVSAAGVLPLFRSYFCPSLTAKQKRRHSFPWNTRRLSGPHCLAGYFLPSRSVRTHSLAQHLSSLAVSSARERQKPSHLELHFLYARTVLRQPV